MTNGINKMNDDMLTPVENPLSISYKYTKGDEPRKSVTSIEVFHWPEFKALCARLGVVYQLPTTAISITLYMELPPSITQTYNGTDMHEVKSVKEMDPTHLESTLRDETWRTRSSML